MIKLASDENLDDDVVRGLLRRVPAIDILRIQDAGQAGAPDPEVLTNRKQELSYEVLTSLNRSG